MVVRGLVFQDSAAEAAFAAHRRASKHDGHLVARLSRLAKWGGLLAVGGTCPAKTPAAVLLASSLLAMILAAASTRVARRLAYPLEAAINVTQALCACMLFHHLYPAAPGASALRALASVLAGNGVLALACLAKTSPLPFRWQLPVVAAVGAALLAHTSSFCGNGLLQHGYATLTTAARIALPLVAPAFADCMPPDGLAALLAPAPPASEAAAAQCVEWQASAVVLGCVALSLHLFRSEQRQRKAFLAASPTVVPAAA